MSCREHAVDERVTPHRYVDPATGRWQLLTPLMATACGTEEPNCPLCRAIGVAHRGVLDCCAHRGDCDHPRSVYWLRPYTSKQPAPSTAPGPTCACKSTASRIIWIPVHHDRVRPSCFRCLL